MLSESVSPAPDIELRPKSGRRRWLVIGLVATVGFMGLLLGWWYRFRGAEPDCLGLRVSVWIRLLRWEEDYTKRDKAIERLRSAGAEAVHVWRAVLRTGPTPGEWLGQNLGRVPLLRTQLLRVLRTPASSLGRLKLEALQHLEELGPDGAAALPELVTLFRENDDPQYQSKVARTIVAIGAGAITALPELVRAYALCGYLCTVPRRPAIAELGVPEEQVREICRSLLEDSDWRCRLEAAGYLLDHPAYAIQAKTVLLRALNGVDQEISQRAAIVLLSRGTEVVAATAVLKKTAGLPSRTNAFRVK
jgi:hypothetical protein